MYRARMPRTTPDERAAAHSLTVEAAPPRRVAGRLEDSAPIRLRARPLVIALDTDSVHTGREVVPAWPASAAARAERPPALGGRRTQHVRPTGSPDQFHAATATATWHRWYSGTAV